MTWHYLHYVLGLAHLGHDVYFLDRSVHSLQTRALLARGRGDIDDQPVHFLSHGADLTKLGIDLAADGHAAAAERPLR